MHRTSAFAVAAMVIGLAASACSSGSTDPGAIATTTAAASSEAITTSPAAAGADLQALIPQPVNTQQTKGPDKIPDGGIHLQFQVGAAPNDGMAAYKALLAEKGWDLTTIVTSGSGSGGGGATYTGTHGDAYGVFDGGGFDTTTYINVCAWPSKPLDPNCTRS